MLRVLLIFSREELIVMLQIMDWVAANFGMHINARKLKILSIDTEREERDAPETGGDNQ